MYIWIIRHRACIRSRICCCCGIWFFEWLVCISSLFEIFSRTFSICRVLCYIHTLCVCAPFIVEPYTLNYYKTLSLCTLWHWLILHRSVVAVVGSVSVCARAREHLKFPICTAFDQQQKIDLSFSERLKTCTTTTSPHFFLFFSRSRSIAVSQSSPPPNLCLMFSIRPFFVCLFLRYCVFVVIFGRSSTIYFFFVPFCLNNFPLSWQEK